MFWSLKLLTVRGIPIRVHASFLLVLFYAAYIGFSSRTGAGWSRGVIFMVAFILLLFLCVVMHELGHSLVAQLFGVKVQDITLWPIGGVARMTRLPERPYQEFLMTAAGPATNVLLAIFLGILALVIIGPQQLLDVLLSPWLLNVTLAEMSGLSLLLLLLVNNVILALFNLIPAFPMDGGRLLRSFLAALIPFGRATAIASVVGQVIAVIMTTLALLTGNFTLALVGAFVFIAALGERRQATIHANFQGLRVRQAMQSIGPRLHPLQTLGEAASLAATSPQAAYLVVDGGRLAGALLRSDLLAALRRAGPAARVGQHVRRNVAQLAPDEPLERLQERLDDSPAAVVVEAGQVIGVITQGDLVHLAELLAVHAEALPRG
ncbi:MAG: site-2 protease family protein [Chloroflexi bacterium]|nr:site-2 protease family protein [Chloroflexota bacterium]